MSRERTTTLEVSGMTCQHCVRSVERAVGGLDGVSEVEVSLTEGTARVVHDPERAPVESLERAIVDEGYEASERAA